MTTLNDHRLGENFDLDLTTTAPPLHAHLLKIKLPRQSDGGAYSLLDSFYYNAKTAKIGLILPIIQNNL